MSTSAGRHNIHTLVVATGFLLAAATVAPVTAGQGSPDPSGVAPGSPVPVNTSPADPGPVMTKLTLPDGLVKAPLSSVIAGGPGFIAVGGGGPEDGGPSTPLILTSADGVAWAPVDLGDVGKPGYLDDVTAFPGGYAAVGGSGGTDGQDAVALVSADGLHWQQSKDKDLRRTQMVGVTARADGLFAVGTINDFEAIGFTSTDGLAWKRVPVPGGYTPTSVAGADGLLVVVGTFGVIAESEPVIATTTDLTHWTQRTLGIGGFLGEADVFGERIVVAGVDINQLTGVDRSVVVYSPNAGKRWIQLPDTAPSNSRFEGISTAGPTIAYGTQLNADRIGHPAAWVTRVGADWQRVRTPASGTGRGTIFDLVPSPDGSGWIAVGGAGNASDTAAIWVIGPAGD